MDPGSGALSPRTTLNPLTVVAAVGSWERFVADLASASEQEGDRWKGPGGHPSQGGVHVSTQVDGYLKNRGVVRSVLSERWNVVFPTRWRGVAPQRWRMLEPGSSPGQRDEFFGYLDDARHARNGAVHAALMHSAAQAAEQDGWYHWDSDAESDSVQSGYARGVAAVHLQLIDSTAALVVHDYHWSTQQYRLPVAWFEATTCIRHYPEIRFWVRAEAAAYPAPIGHQGWFCPPAARVSGAGRPRQGRSLSLASRFFGRWGAGQASGLRPPLDPGALWAPDPMAAIGRAGDPWSAGGCPGWEETEGGDLINRRFSGHEYISMPPDLDFCLDLLVLMCHNQDTEWGSRPRLESLNPARVRLPRRAARSPVTVGRHPLFSSRRGQLVVRPRLFARSGAASPTRAPTSRFTSEGHFHEHCYARERAERA